MSEEIYDLLKITIGKLSDQNFKLKSELFDAREALYEARKHREQFNSILQSYIACWEEIKSALGEPEEGDQTCDLDRVVKAIRERDEAREELEFRRGLYKVQEEYLESEKNTRNAIIAKGLELKKQLDEAQEKLKHITEYGTEEINAAVELRQKLATALVERDEAREALREIWQSGDVFLPHVDQETTNRWRRAAGWEETK